MTGKLRKKQPEMERILPRDRFKLQEACIPGVRLNVHR
jgi:hypothetical protein